MNKIIAIIPARGGSKRLPNKNILPLAGKPMIAWTIEAALNSRVFCDVLVSTDSQEIADVARKYGASVPFLRDAKDADDVTPVSTATLNTLRRFEEYSSARYPIVAQLMPNCPCRSSLEIQQALIKFYETRARFQISVFKFGWMNPWWAMKLEGAQIPAPLFPEAYKQRSQDLPDLYCPTGAVWIADSESLKQQGTFYGKDYQVYSLDWQSAVDIDDAEDFKMAEVVFLLRGKFEK